MIKLENININTDSCDNQLDLLNIDPQEMILFGKFILTHLLLEPNKYVKGVKNGLEVSLKEHDLATVLKNMLENKQIPEKIIFLFVLRGFDRFIRTTLDIVGTDLNVN